MKYLLLFLILCATTLNAQTNLHFDKRLIVCEDKWVALQKDKDSLYSYGFIYIDPEAGLTLDLAGTFRIDEQGTFVPQLKFDSFSVKHRLEPGKVLAAFIPENKFADLKIAATPAWLKYYKADSNSVKQLYRRGFLYNAWDECERALVYLEKAQKTDPLFQGLSFELAYAYNALGKYDQAIAVLESAIKTNPEDCYLYKELSYAQIHSAQLDKAAATCTKGISFCKDNNMKSEIAYNLAQQFYRQKDKVNFSYWAHETKKWATAGDRYTVNITAMEKELNP